MENTENSKTFNMSRLAMTCAIIGLVTDFLMLSLDGVPFGIPFGIFGIALATLCKDEDGKKLNKKGRTALIISIIALVLGILLYVMTLAVTGVMSDPEMSKLVIDTLKSLKDQFPPEMQQMFEQAGISLE